MSTAKARREIKTDRDRGVRSEGGSVYYSLGSPDWQNLTGGPSAQYTYTYFPPGHGWDDGEYASMCMADWGNEGAWFSAKMRLNVALGFGAYEQSVLVGVGSGVTTTFYLCEKDTDGNQEIDMEFSGHCYPGNTPCGTSSVWTNFWWNKQQSGQATPLWTGSTPPTPLPNTTKGWGYEVYRYKIDWTEELITWSVDLTGTGENYVVIRSQVMTGMPYNESALFPFISFWQGWTPDGSPFLKGADAQGDCGASGKCYQAFYFQSLKFTPAPSNQAVKLIHP
jgi:Glycosyl hydrolases family 16